MIKKMFYTEIPDMLKDLYGTDAIIQKKRYDKLQNGFVKRFRIDELKDVRFFSAPGRIEILGNHTDHQNGHVLTAAIQRDIIAIVKKNDSNLIRIHSNNYRDITVKLSKVYEVPDAEALHAPKGTSYALVLGVAYKLASEGYKLCGFDANLTTDVPPGYGLSSSAAFEVLIASIFNELANDNSIPPMEIAKIGQYAENVFFGKPCGLMDEAACALGGCNLLNFADPNSPAVKSIPWNKMGSKYTTIVVYCGGNHRKLTNAYASIVSEMGEVSKFFGVDHLNEIDYNRFNLSLPSLRKTVSDRAILRAMHFYNENKRVVTASEEIEKENIEGFLDCVNESGTSSFELLQNVFGDNIPDRSVSLALAITKQFLKDNNCKGACRIHGGGFMGTILVMLPRELAYNYCSVMNNVFKMPHTSQVCCAVNVREHGGVSFPAEK